MRFYEKKFAVEYNSRLQRENYPGKLFDIINDKLKGSKTIIDVGAGSGFFSIPFLKNGYEVIAVEPSIEMINLLKDKLNKNISSKIKIINKTWESVELDYADTLICIHAIYPMGNFKNAILKMRLAADKKILVVRNKASISLSEIIKISLNKNINKNFSKEIEEILNIEKINFKKEIFITERVASFSNIKKEANYYLFRLKLDNKYLDNIIDTLEKNTQFYNGIYSYRGKYQDNIFIF
jgi:predicted RNA methylase